MMLNNKNAPKIIHQPKASAIKIPIMGATTGTRRNTIIVNERILAIVRPEYKSRIIAVDTTRGPAAPSPCNARAASINSSVGAVQQRTAPTEYIVRPK